MNNPEAESVNTICYDAGLILFAMSLKHSLINLCLAKDDLRVTFLQFLSQVAVFPKN